jgi:hypothetical protein
MELILMALLYVAVFSLVAWAVVALIPVPNATVATVRNILVALIGIIFAFWLLRHVGIFSADLALRR